ncbi:hypothetical protein N7453_010589 [Penicillium expansum]|nr:hypothetical protein N7453_010589 [Penicillium expansum]
MWRCGVDEYNDFPPPTDPETPSLLPWSRSHRLYPLEQSRGAYMPVELVAAAVLATGYRGPISLEVFSASLNQPGETVPAEHASRGIKGLSLLYETAKSLPAFWKCYDERMSAIEQVVRRLQSDEHKHKL